ncbi:hypothetical protein PR003_g29033 [Phytophthora rubi]|uniref:Uncharacterized protein n=1 Tax=Phytophthora rubi TaxID=129364 RepID=A0A6A4BUZ0_9STRA|nr:hypothetical protein PR003_g29033 [Phytophthora rubi]
MADHKAVRLQLRSPTDPVRVRKPSRVYPPPSVAAEAVRVVTQQRLTTFLEDLQVSDQDAATWARAWDEFKVELRKDTLSIIKARRKSTRAFYNQKLRRLWKQEIRLQEHRAGTDPTVESITEGMDVLSLRDGHGGSSLQRVRHEIQACTRARADAQQRRLFRAAGHSDGKTTRALFRRVSNKYADNEIHRLDAAIGHSDMGVHDKADTLADAWTPIFQQSRFTAAARSEVLHWLGDAGRYQDVLADFTDAFTEGEVAAAIGASKPGKACGPDRLVRTGTAISRSCSYRS